MSDNGKQNILEVYLDNENIKYKWGTGDIRTRMYIVKLLDLGVTETMLEMQAKAESSKLIMPATNIPPTVMERLK